MKRLAAVLIAAPLLLTGCVVPYGGATTTATNSLPPAGAKIYSKLDEPGIKDIKASKFVLLDMENGRLTKESVGLADGSSQAPDVHTDTPVEVIIEAPYTAITARSDRIRLNGMNGGPDFSEVTYFLTAKSLDELSTLIREGVGRYGIPSDPAEGLIQSISAKPDQKSDFAITPGTSTGVQVTYDLRYDGSKDTQVIIVHVNPL